MKRNKSINQKMIETKTGRFRSWKKGKKWLYGSSVLIALAGLGGISTGVIETPFFGNELAYALSLPAGATQVGTINNAPVIKSPTDDISSQTFKDIVSALLEGQETPPVVVNQVFWGSSTSLHSGQTLASFGQTASAVFRADGYVDSDLGINLNVGQSAYINNVGTALDTATGKTIPLSLQITLQKAEGFGSSTGPLTAFDSSLMMAKSQSGVITLGWGTLSSGGSEGGGQTEGGGVGGGTSDGSSMMFIDNVAYKVTLINSDTGKVLPDNTLMPVKMSDIDASQLATMGGEGVKGYILSPDTALTQSGNGFQSTSDGTLIEDSTDLTSNSYIVLKAWNQNTVGYKYTDGLNNHMDIVTGIFGNTPWDLSDLLGGYIEVDKSTVQYGKDEWNEFYGFETISFDVIDKNGKVVDTIQLNADGKGKSERIPAGTYTLREKSSDWSKTGQTVIKDQTVIITAGETISAKPQNTAVTGQITIKKTGVESGESVWNENYTLANNTFLLTSKTDGKTYTVKTDAAGKAVAKDLPLGTYTIEETAASNGFVNTFEKKEVTLTYKDQNTEVVFGDTAGTNQEIKGENTLHKVDKDTELEQNGKAVLKTAKYQLFYNDTSTGSSPHKAGDSVKWTDKPAPELKIGEKVTEAVIGGTNVDFGDAVVIDVDDESLKAAVGNLAAGKYYWLEVDAGEGYVTDPTKHEFEIKKADDKTETIITDDTKSLEQIIKAKINLDKSVTLPENQGGSGYNGIEFTATPLEGTIAEPVTFKTGINPNTGDDGYASQELVYGDWILEETKGVEGYEDVKPIYIHMTTDAEKDLLTISASFKEDFSQPFSIRTFSLKDSSTTDNPNAEEAGSVGEVSSEVPTISLSTIRFNDNPGTPVEPEPEKPTKDVTKTDGGGSINGGNVALASDFVYVLNSSIKASGREDITQWFIDDDFDENFDSYNGTYKVYATTDFGEYKAGDVLPADFFKDEEKDGHVIFTAQKAFLDVLNANKDKEVGFSIRADFYRFVDSDKVVNTFDETINDRTEKSNEVDTNTPEPQPHKFDLSEAKYDLLGDNLLDDDSEMNNRYEDSNKDPYADDAKNNEKENINTAAVKRGQVLNYQLWLDTTPFDETSELVKLGMVDDYDETALTADVENVHIYDKDGKDVTEHFTIEDKDGKLTIAANVFKEATNSAGEKVQVVDTDKIVLGQYYKIDLPMTVKSNVKSDYDIVNTASQFWTDSDNNENSHITEKRVNKVTDGTVTPSEGKQESIAEALLPNTGTKKAIYLTLIGLAMILTVVAAKRKQIQSKLRSWKLQLKK